MKKLFSAFILFICCFSAVFGQYYDNGQDPSSLHWRSLQTEYYRIIYPDYYEHKAQKIGLIADSLYPLVKSEMGFINGRKKHKRKLPLVLHTQSSYANAFLAWAPRRMEWYTGTPQNIYAQSWFEQLAIHETRHELQMQRMDQGFISVWTSIFGEHFIGLVSGIFVPQWFLEGDAVWAETKLSHTGRGREADFIALNKAQVIDKKIYSYDKAIFGSYKDFVPNIYNLGYHVIAYTNEQVEYNLWQKALDKTADVGSLRPFNLSGQRKQLYKDAMSYWKNVWLTDTTGKEDNSQTISKKSKVYTNYYSPFFINDSTIYAYKTNYLSSPFLVEVRKEGDKKIKAFGNTYDGFLDYHNEKIIWVESVPDIRWQNVTFSDLSILELETNRRKFLSKDKHYFSPAFSPSGEKIAVIEIGSIDNHSIVIINSDNGKVIFKSCPFSYALSYPTWSKDEKEIFFIQLASNGKSIRKLSLDSDKSFEVIPTTYSNIRNLKILQENLYFISDQDGTSQVYEYNLKTKEIFQVTNSKYGIGTFNFSLNNEELVFTSYNANGYDVKKQNISFKTKSTYNKNFVETPKSFDLAIKESPFKSQPYLKSENLINFHSWSPIGVPTDASLPQNPGITFMSQNLLSTSFLNAGYAYNYEEGTNQFFLGYTYKGFFPILSTTQLLQQRYIHVADTMPLSWNEFRSQYYILLPFSFTKFNHSFGLSMRGSYEFVYHYNGLAGDIPNLKKVFFYNIHVGGFDINFVHTVKRGYAQLQPKWKQSISFNYRLGLSGESQSNVLGISGSFYFPGLFSTHSLNVYTGYQMKDESAVTFNNLIRTPRGYQSLYLPNESLTLQVNYAFPFAYPDGGIPGVFYCKRLIANPFFDITSHDELYYSSGLELYGDFNFLRFDTPVTFGIRYAYLPIEKSSAWNIIFSVSF